MTLVFDVDLADVAHEWAHYRTQTGWTVSELPIKPSDDTDAQALQLISQLNDAWGDALAGGADEYCVLLLGDSDAIPTFRFPQHDPDLAHRRDTHFATDHPYRAGDTAHDQPHFALGRIPAHTADEARIALNKIKAYESANAPALWQRRINCLAGEGHFGPLDTVLETVFTRMVDTLVPPSFDMSMTYAKATSIYCPPIDAITPTIQNRLAEDSFLFFYVGHGAPTSLDSFYWRNERRETLRSNDLANVVAVGVHRPIAVLACCSTGWFDLPRNEHSLAEAMLFSPDGPVAVIAGSRPTHPYANAVLLESFTRRATQSDASTLGQLDLLVTRDMLRAPSMNDAIDLISTPIAAAMQWSTSLRDHRRMHVRLYNLLGDPCLALPDQGSDMQLTRHDSTITGAIANMTHGSVTVTLQTSRLDPAKAASLETVTDENDPALPEKSAVNYPIANDRTLATLTADVVDGAFEISLPQPLDERAAMITFHAIGVDEDGNIIAAHGAMPAHDHPPALRIRLR